MDLVWTWLVSMFGHWQNWLSGGGLGGLALIVLWLLEKYHPRGWTLAKRWHFAIVASFFVLGASFLTWKDQYDRAFQMASERDKLQTQIDNLQSPKFDMNFDQINMGLFYGATDYSAVMFRLTVTNSGAPSFARLKDCTLRIKDGREIAGQLVLHTKQGFHGSVPGNKNVSLDAPMSDYFEIKATLQPIPSRVLKNALQFHSMIG